MRYSAAILIPILLLCTPAAAQTAGDGPQTAAYLEALGPTEFGSINLERSSTKWALRGGLQIAGSGRSLGEHYLQVPLSVGRLAYLLGFGLEAGAGTVVTVNDQYGWDLFEYFGSVGVRSPHLIGSTFVRAEALVFPSDEWRQTVGIAVGYAF